MFLLLILMAIIFYATIKIALCLSVVGAYIFLAIIAVAVIKDLIGR